MWQGNHSISKDRRQMIHFIPGLQTLFKNHDSPSINKMIDEALLLALTEYKSKSGKREHFILQGNRKYTFFPPNTLKMKFKINRMTRILNGGALYQKRNWRLPACMPLA